ncbi:MAG: hypothetical protein GC192_04000 [Bacteroidetes bacterium]|nr:hypothetical protein [Bacteroidota bacterium]
MPNFANYYYIIIALQAFCLYHAYKNHTQQKWYWIILFVPAIGSLLYLYENFYNRRNIDSLAEGVKGLVFSNYEVGKLEKEVKFSPTLTNKINLGNAYTERGRYDEALALYASCEKGYNEDNPELLHRLLKVYYLKKDYEKVVGYGKKLEPVKKLGDSDDKVAYAWALHRIGETEKAEAKFKELDSRFANYLARLEYARFMIETGRSAPAKTLLNNILEECDSMDRYEKSSKKWVVREAKRILQGIKSYNMP